MRMQYGEPNVFRLAAAIGVFLVFLVIGFVQTDAPQPAPAQEKVVAAEKKSEKPATQVVAAPVAASVQR